MLPPTETVSDATTRVDDACTCASVQSRLDELADDTDPCIVAHLATCASCRRDASHRIALLDRLRETAERAKSQETASDALRARIAALLSNASRS